MTQSHKPFAIVCETDSGLSCHAALSQYHTRWVQALLTLPVVFHAFSNLHNLGLPCHCDITYTGIWDTCVGFTFFSCPKRVPEITVPSRAAPLAISQGLSLCKGSVHVCAGLCSRPQTGEMFCLHVCQQPTLRWESSQSLVHNLGSCFWLGLQIDLHKRPLWCTFVTTLSSYIYFCAKTSYFGWVSSQVYVISDKESDRRCMQVWQVAHNSRTAEYRQAGQQGHAPMHRAIWTSLKPRCLVASKSS